MSPFTGVRRLWRAAAVVAVSVGMAVSLAPAPVAHAADQTPLDLSGLQSFWQNVVTNLTPPALDPSTAPTQLAAAQPDECFNGIGVNYADFPDCPVAVLGNDPISGQPITTGDKINQAYVWGLTETLGKNWLADTQENQLWYGTAANVECMVLGGYLESANIPQLNDSYTCEFGQSEYARNMFAFFATQVAPALGVNPNMTTWDPNPQNWTAPQMAYARLVMTMNATGDWRPPKAYWQSVTDPIDRKSVV